MNGNIERLTVCCEARAQIEEKRSVFIGSVSPVRSEDDARAFIERIKKEFYDARHNVYAYILDGGSVCRFTDDGEPKGSAGIPVLNVLKMSGVDGVCIVVTRYFGGILLGTGGLVRAYSAAAKAALDAAGISVMSTYVICEICCSYSDYTKISAKLDTVGAVEESCDFSSEVKICVSILPSDTEALTYLINQITAGKCKISVIRTEERAKRQR